MFAVAAEAYDRFMGRYSVPLAPLFADYAGIACRSRCSTWAAAPEH